MIRSLASLFGLRWHLSSGSYAAQGLRFTRYRGDALGEYLRSSNHAEMTPEILLRIL